MYGTRLFVVLIGMAACIGIIGSVLQASIYGFANMFHSPRYTQGTMVGQATTGIAISAVRIYLKYQSGDTENALYVSSKWFFAAGWIFMLIVSNSYYKILRRLCLTVI